MQLLLRDVERLLLGQLAVRPGAANEIASVFARLDAVELEAFLDEPVDGLSALRQAF